MNIYPSCFSWQKKYLYVDHLGQFQHRTLNFFQRGLRFLGFYSETRLSSLAVACLQPRIWNTKDQSEISLLLNKIKQLPPVKWTETHGHSKIHIECVVTVHSLRFYFYEDSLFKRISDIWFKKTSDVWDVYLEYHRKNDLPTIVSSIGKIDSCVRHLAFEVFIQLAANSSAAQIPKIFWYSEPRMNIYAEEAKKYDLTLEGDAKNVDSSFVSGHLYLTHDKAFELNKKHRIKTPYSFDFFAVLKNLKRS